MNTLWDGGSTLSFITFNKAKELKLQGRKVKLGIIKVGAQTTELDSCLYNVSLVESSGRVHAIEAFGIERISSSIESVNMEEIAKIFNIERRSIARPQSGEVDLLLGIQYASLHPVRTKSSGNLLLMENQFDRVIAGSHPLVQNCPHITQ